MLFDWNRMIASVFDMNRIGGLHLASSRHFSIQIECFSFWIEKPRLAALNFQFFDSDRIGPLSLHCTSAPATPSPSHKAMPLVKWRHTHTRVITLTVANQSSGRLFVACVCVCVWGSTSFYLVLDSGFLIDSCILPPKLKSPNFLWLATTNSSCLPQQNVSIWAYLWISSCDLLYFCLFPMFNIYIICRISFIYRPPISWNQLKCGLCSSCSHNGSQFLKHKNMQIHSAYISPPNGQVLNENKSIKCCWIHQL